MTNFVQGLNTMAMWTRLSLILLLVFAATGQAANMPDRHVVVISIDGLPSYILDDPHASLPIIRKLKDAGVSAKAGMRVSNPSVTWPNHTTLMTGVHPERHGVLYNGVAERLGRGQAVRITPGKTQQELVRVPLLFDVLKEAGLSSAAINWPCTRGSTSLDDNFPDVPDSLEYATPCLKDELAKKGLLERFEAGGGVVRDEVWTEAACQVLRERAPRLLTLHLINLDLIHHQYGPQTAPGYTAIALMDALVGRVLDAIDDAGIREKTTVFVISDHGFAAVKKSLLPNAILRREGLLQTGEKGRITAARVFVVPQGGIGMVYLADPETAEKDRETVKHLFQNAEGVAALIEPDEYARYHLPRPADHPGMADLILAAKDGYSVSGATTGDVLVVTNELPSGSHGYLSTEPKMNALFVASGAGTKSGVRLDAIDNVDLAPTVAKLLGVPLNQATGRVLSEILEDRP